MSAERVWSAGWGASRLRGFSHLPGPERLSSHAGHGSGCLGASCGELGADLRDAEHCICSPRPRRQLRFLVSPCLMGRGSGAGNLLVRSSSRIGQRRPFRSLRGPGGALLDGAVAGCERLRCPGGVGDGQAPPKGFDAWGLLALDLRLSNVWAPHRRRLNTSCPPPPCLLLEATFREPSTLHAPSPYRCRCCPFDRSVPYCLQQLRVQRPGRQARGQALSVRCHP